jgi:hypothetical protein
VKEGAVIGDITRSRVELNYSRIHNVHYAIDSLKEWVGRKGLLDDRTRRDSVGSVGSGIVGWRMSDEADGEEDDKQVEPNRRASDERVTLQSPYLTQNHATALGSQQGPASAPIYSPSYTRIHMMIATMKQRLPLTICTSDCAELREFVATFTILRAFV